METIQRGDQVYYRGEVWRVYDVVRLPNQPPLIQIEPFPFTGTGFLVATASENVQRVEQVR